MDVEVGEGLGDLDLEMERMRSAGVGSRRWPVESVDEAVVDVEAVCRVTALPSRAAARRSESVDGVLGASGSAGASVSSGVVAGGAENGFQDMGMNQNMK